MLRGQGERSWEQLVLLVGWWGRTMYLNRGSERLTRHQGWFCIYQKETEAMYSAWGLIFWLMTEWFLHVSEDKTLCLQWIMHASNQCSWREQGIFIEYALDLIYLPFRIPGAHILKKQKNKKGWKLLQQSSISSGFVWHFSNAFFGVACLSREREEMRKRWGERWKRKQSF